MAVDGIFVLHTMLRPRTQVKFSCMNRNHLFVGQNENGQPQQLALRHESVQSLVRDREVTAAVNYALVRRRPSAALGNYALIVFGIHDKNDERAVLKVVPPERPDLIAAADVPYKTFVNDAAS